MRDGLHYVEECSWGDCTENLHYPGFYRPSNDYDASNFFAGMLTEGIDNGASQPASAKAEMGREWGVEEAGISNGATRDCNRQGH